MLLPSDFGYKAWAFEPHQISGSSALTGGVLFLVKIRLPGLSGTVSITNIELDISGAGAGLVANQNFVALYSGDGQTRIGVSGDLSGTWNSGGPKTVALTSGPFNVAVGFVYVAMLANGTTAPSPYRAGNSFSANGKLAAASGFFFATNLSGQTSMPATLTVSSFTASTARIWAGLS